MEVQIADVTILLNQFALNTNIETILIIYY